MGSRLHDSEGEDFIISLIAPDDKSLNSDNVEDKDTSGTFAEEGLQWKFTLFSDKPS